MSALPYEAFHWKTTLAGDIELRAAPLTVTCPDSTAVRLGVTYGIEGSQSVGTLTVTGGTGSEAVDYTSLRTYLRTRVLAEESISALLAAADALAETWPELAPSLPFLVMELSPRPDANLPGGWQIRATFLAYGSDSAVVESIATRAANLFVGTRFEVDGWMIRAVISDGVETRALERRDGDGACVRACAASILMRAMRQ